MIRRSARSCESLCRAHVPSRIRALEEIEPAVEEPEPRATRNPLLTDEDLDNALERAMALGLSVSAYLQRINAERKEPVNLS